jgi:hypothetical protein
VSRLVLVLVLLASLAGGAAAGEVDARTRRALAELKRLCDGGLVAPVVCLEKQRELLGLAGATPPPGVAERQPGPGAAPPVGRLAGPGLLHESPLGVRLTLAPGWTPLGADAVAQGFAVLQERLAANPQAVALLERVQRRSMADGLDVFASGGDQLQLTVSAAAPPADAAAGSRFCGRLAANAPVVPGRPMQTWSCESRTVGGRPALYVERDALVPGTRTMNYWLPLPDGKALHIVLTCVAEHADARRDELAAMVESVVVP